MRRRDVPRRGTHFDRWRDDMEIQPSDWDKTWVRQAYLDYQDRLDQDD